MTIDTGGAAFPVPGSDTYSPETGMSLRDYFAGQALAYTADLCTNTDKPWEENAARQAYKLADAMIREKRRTEATP